MGNKHRQVVGNLFSWEHVKNRLSYNGMTSVWYFIMQQNLCDVIDSLFYANDVIPVFSFFFKLSDSQYIELFKLCVVMQLDSMKQECATCNK